MSVAKNSLYYNVAGGLGVFYQAETYSGSFPATLSLPNTCDVDGAACIYCNYTPTTTPSTPVETYASGYLTRYQKRQIIGYYRNSGDLRAVEVNASGHFVADIEVAVSSGLFIDGVSGTHVYVESGANVVANVIINSGLYVNAYGGTRVSGCVQVSGAVLVSGSVRVSGTVEVSGRVSILSGLVGILSGNINLNPSVTVRTGDLKLVTSASGGEEIVPTTGWCSGNTNQVIIKNLSGNSDIFIGGATCKPYSGHGFMLSDQEAVTLAVSKAYNVYGCANISGQKLSYIGTDY